MGLAGLLTTPWKLKACRYSLTVEDDSCLFELLSIFIHILSLFSSLPSEPMILNKQLRDGLISSWQFSIQAG